MSSIDLTKLNDAELKNTFLTERNRRRNYAKETNCLNCNEDWAEYIAQVEGLSRDEEDSVLSDLANMRADEVYLNMKENGDAPELLEAFREFYSINEMHLL